MMCVRTSPRRAVLAGEATNGCCPQRRSRSEYGGRSRVDGVSLERKTDSLKGEGGLSNPARVSVESNHPAEVEVETDETLSKQVTCAA